MQGFNGVIMDQPCVNESWFGWLRSSGTDFDSVENETQSLDLLVAL